MLEKKLDWGRSLSNGVVTEVAVMAPLKLGRVPNERRTYEERVRYLAESFNTRVRQGIPTELNRITRLHYGRISIVRPENYLTYSNVPDVDYYPDTGDQKGQYKVPLPFEEYEAVGGAASATQPNKDRFRSHLLVQVIFDGDINVYFREITQIVGEFADPILSNCEDYPGAEDFERFMHWIRRYQLNNDLLYSAYRDLTVPRIKHLQHFRQQFDAFVEQVRSPEGRLVENLDELFDAFLRENWQHGSGFPAEGGTYPAIVPEGE